MSDENPMGQVIQIDEARIRDHLGEMVRGTVEETLNAMLDAEADQLCGAGRYERSQARQDSHPLKSILVKAQLRTEPLLRSYGMATACWGARLHCFAPIRWRIVVSIAAVALLHSFSLLGPLPPALAKGNIAGHGSVHFVAIGGNDSGPGTEARPWATLNHAAEKARAGDTIVIHGGRYACQ